MLSRARGVCDTSRRASAPSRCPAVSHLAGRPVHGLAAVSGLASWVLSGAVLLSACGSSRRYDEAVGVRVDPHSQVRMNMHRVPRPGDEISGTHDAPTVRQDHLRTRSLRRDQPGPVTVGN
jgi:hypothetical protein